MACAEPSHVFLCSGIFETVSIGYLLLLGILHSLGSMIFFGSNECHVSRGTCVTKDVSYEFHS